MIWLPTFSFLVLAGLTQAQDHLSISSVTPGNSTYSKISPFPYYSLPFKQPNDDLYTSTIVSYESGPLCSGFHVSSIAVVTAASCVFRESAKNLFVISHNVKNTRSFEFLPVTAIHLNTHYNPKTDEHNIAVLQVNKSTNVPILKLPPLESPNTGKQLTNTFIAKYTFDEKLKDFSTISLPVEVNFNLESCTDKFSSLNSFLCVSQTNNRPYSYGLADLGTPLVFKSDKGDFLSGVFTGHHYNEFHSHYLYQNAFANLNFIYPYSFA